MLRSLLFVHTVTLLLYKYCMYVHTIPSYISMLFHIYVLYIHRAHTFSGFVLLRKAQTSLVLSYILRIRLT